MESQFERVAQFVSNISAPIVALQFHQSILALSMPVLETLSARFQEIRFLIIGDSAFSSCCTDYLSAKHVDAGGIIHLGHSCNTDCPIPILHIQDPFVPDLDSLDPHELPTPLFVEFYATEEAWRHLLRKLDSKGVRLTNERSEAVGILYIGNGYSLPLLIKNVSQQVLTLSSRGFERHDPYAFISKRYHYISQVKQASVFGLLILSIPLYKRIGQRICALLRSHQKAVYPIYMGKITQGKLGNFNEIDMFVMVSCAHRELPSNRELYKPIITPFELEAGLRDSWDGGYSTEFSGEECKEPEGVQSVADRFQSRGFKGLEVETDGKVQVEEGYSGIASRYKSEFRRTM